MKHFSFLPALALLLAALLCGSILAADGSEYCFAEDAFAPAGAQPDGVFLSQVPDPRVGDLQLGSRLLRPGDVIASGQLGDLRLYPRDGGEAQVVFRPITGGHVDIPQTVTVSLFSKVDQPPTAKDSRMETYKNIANDGTLDASDPEGGRLTYTLVKEPRRGTVELREDGTFTYTPDHNKVGRDSFLYTAADEAGNCSEEATVEIEILRPADKVTYADMTGDPGHFAALWMREQGLLTGETVAGVPCFHPERPVSRGEFLAMTMKLLGREPGEDALQTGFADESDTPLWMQPYIATALQWGVISGVDSDDGIVFRPTTAMTRAEAAVLLQNALQLPEREDITVFADEAVPAWAARSMEALSCAGIDLHSISAENLTRRDAAKLLRQVAELLERGKIRFAWEQ